MSRCSASLHMTCCSGNSCPGRSQMQPQQSLACRTVQLMLPEQGQDTCLLCSIDHQQMRPDPEWRWMMSLYLPRPWLELLCSTETIG